MLAINVYFHFLSTRSVKDMRFGGLWLHDEFSGQSIEVQFVYGGSGHSYEDRIPSDYGFSSRYLVIPLAFEKLRIVGYGPLFDAVSRKIS